MLCSALVSITQRKGSHTCVGMGVTSPKSCRADVDSRLGLGRSTIADASASAPKHGGIRAPTEFSQGPWLR